jgi:hypothetical protein
MNKPNQINWNTGNPYTEHGQRIYARSIDGGVFMHDQDRGLSYFYPECKLDQWEIMHRYNNNLDFKYSSPTVDEIGRYKLIDEMIAASLA